jgi:Extracellular mutant protein 11
MASKMNGFVTQKTVTPAADIMNARRAEIGNSVRIKKGDTRRTTNTENALPIETSPPGVATEQEHAMKEEVSRQKYTFGMNTSHLVTRMTTTKYLKDSQIRPIANDFVDGEFSSEIASHDENHPNDHYYEGEMTPAMIRTMNQFNNEAGGYDSYPPTTDGGMEQAEDGKDYSGSGSEDDDDDDEEEESADQLTPKKLAPAGNPDTRSAGLHQNTIPRLTAPQRTSSMNVTVSESTSAPLASRQHAHALYQLPQRGGNNRLVARPNEPNGPESPTRRPKSNIQRHQGYPQRGVQFPIPPLQHHGHTPIQMALPPRQTYKFEPMSMMTHPPQNLTDQTKSKPRTTTHAKQQQAAPVQEEVHQSPVQVSDKRKVLDYTPEELADMPYSKLQEESFDVDPCAQPLQFEAQLKSTLQESLVSVRQLHTEEQKRFFASLPLTQWEEAGDWFLDQFSEVLNKFRAARKTRRQVAASLEAEISSRNQEVETRKRKLDEVMAEMKASGVGVLSQNNHVPKKKREE